MLQEARGTAGSRTQPADVPEEPPFILHAVILLRWALWKQSLWLQSCNHWLTQDWDFPSPFDVRTKGRLLQLGYGVGCQQVQGTAR